MQRTLTIGATLLAISAIGVTTVHASGGDDGSTSAHGGQAAFTFLWIAILLIAAKLSNFITRIGQPAVLGELLIGVVLGNLALIGIHVFDPVAGNEVISFLAQFGVVLLLFQIGLESQIKEMMRIGGPAALVGLMGVAVPFVLGTYVIGPMLMPDLSTAAYLFLGAALTATSVGITVRVFKDVSEQKSKEAQIVLGAAVIDDILGLIILAIVSAIATAGSVSLGTVGFISLKAIAFLVGSIALGRLLAPYLCNLFSRINTGVGMKFAIALSFALVFAFFAYLIGLAPIVGAFAAGLMLDPVHFKDFDTPMLAQRLKDVANREPHAAINPELTQAAHEHEEHHVEDLLEPLSYFLVPLFFVVTGMQVDLSAFLNLSLVLTALGITIVAILGKLVAGLFAGRSVNKWIVGWGMVPRGEVGLIFASIGKSLGVISGDVFSVIVMVVILTTVVAPPALSLCLSRKHKRTVHTPASRTQEAAT